MSKISTYTVSIVLIAFFGLTGCKKSNTTHKKQTSTKKQATTKAVPGAEIKILNAPERIPVRYKRGWKVYQYEITSPGKAKVTFALLDKAESKLSKTFTLPPERKTRLLFAYKKEKWDEKTQDVRIAMMVKGERQEKSISLSSKKGINSKVFGALAGGINGVHLKNKFRHLLYHWIWTDNLQGLNLSTKQDKVILSRGGKTIELKDFPNSVWRLFVTYQKNSQ